MNFVKHYIANFLLLTGLVTVMILSAGCGGSNGKKMADEDKKSKAFLQGVWNNDLEGNTVFSIDGDSIFFNDSLSAPAPFFVRNDTLIIEYHVPVCYPIKKLTNAYFAFVNKEGDVVELTKISEKPRQSIEDSYIAPNQGKTIKRDSVLTYGDIHYHAYSQVNPTTYKVYRQSTNNDGLSIENVYYDNIVYLALYNGTKKVYGQNIIKKDFANLVPDSYLSQAVLSEITIENASAKGVRFIAILSIPDSNTNYRVNIDISPEGKKTLSL